MKKTIISIFALTLAACTSNMSTNMDDMKAEQAKSQPYNNDDVIVPSSTSKAECK